MGIRIFRLHNTKKGTTLLEVVAAAAILSIVVLAALMAVAFSHSTILSGNTEANAAAQAQNLADELMNELHTKTPDEISISGAYKVKANFPDPSKEKQFSIEDSEAKDGVEGYIIRTAVYYQDSNGKKCVQMRAFAAKDGGK
jgi:Tfp pilus assembly protein PilV